MEQKQIVVISICGIAIIVGGAMALSSIGSGAPSRRNLESMMQGLPTDELVVRRQFMASQIHQAKVRGRGGRTDLLASAEKSLAELDALLSSRGVELSDVSEVDQYEMADAMRRSEP